MDNDKFIEYAPRLYDVGSLIANSYRQELKNINAVATGKLINFDFDVVYENDILKLLFDLPRYWGAIEEGRKPSEKSGNVPLHALIEQWIENKGIVPKDGMKKEQLAFAIATAIHQQGFFTDGGTRTYYGKHPLKTAMEKSSDLRDEFAALAGEMVGRTITTDKIITEPWKDVKINL